MLRFPLTTLYPWVAALVWSVASLAMAQSGVTVDVSVVQTRSVGQGFEMDGVVQPVKMSTVSAQASGRILGLNVKAGDQVRAGQLLASIDDREAQSGVLRSQAQVAQAQADLRNAQAHYERTRDLRAQGFVSAAALDAAEMQFKSAQAGRDQASAGDQQTRLQQGFTRVSAPFDAWVLQVQAETGDLAVPGKPLLVLYAPKPLRVVVQVPVTRASQIQSQSLIELELPMADGSRQWVTATARTQVPSADPVSQTVEWRFELPATAQGLLPGQPVRVRFAAGQSQRLVIPAKSVLQRGELTAVYVASAQGFALKAVRLGADHGVQGVEVLAGLRASDRVALDPVRAGLLGAVANVATGK